METDMSASGETSVSATRRAAPAGALPQGPRVPSGREATRGKRRAAGLVRRLMFLRLAVVLGCLAVIVLSQGSRGAFAAELVPSYLLLTGIGLVNLVYLVQAERIRRPRRFAAWQICLDVVFATLLIYTTGAGQSNITFLYFGCILAGSILLGLRPGMLIASLATAMLAGMKMLTFFAEHYGWTLPWAYLPGPDMPVMGISTSVGYLLAQAIAYHLVAALAGQLSRGLSGVRLLNEKLLETISDGVLAVDADGRVHATNGEAMRLLGVRPGTAVLGQTLETVFDGSKNAETMRGLFRDERSGVHQTSLVTADGRVAPAAVVASELREESGRCVGWVIMLVDLTERRRLEEAMARAETMEMVGQLAASIAHEIRNPLACIRGSAQEVRSEIVADEQSMQLLDMVVREADRINTIVTDFLHFSKMRSSALQRCSLTDAVTDVVALLERRQHEPHVQIVLDADESVFCLGDVEQLRQVFLNLGLNALDAMPSGGRLDVVIRRRAPSHVTVEFIDQGEGMTEAVKRQVFNPFFTTKSRGTGLGLAIVQRIVEAHRGQVEVESLPGRGSTVRVVLNAYVEPEPGTPPPACACDEAHAAPMAGVSR